MGLISGIEGLLGGTEGDYYNGLDTPDIEAMKLALEEYVSQGIFTPEEASAVLADPSAFESITSSPEFQEAQMKALAGLQEISDNQGTTASTRARMNEIAKDEATRERGSREAILQNAQQRGVGGSGLEFLSLLKNQEASADRASERDTQAAADAEQRALEALIKGGDTASAMRSQEFNENARIAEAKDAINRFNAQNRQQVNLYNTGVNNAAQQYNLAQQQKLADANVDQRNKAQAYNKGLLQTDYDNRLGLARTKAGAFGNDEKRKKQNIDDIEYGFGSILEGML